jgi:hypothetical protein
LLAGVGSILKQLTCGKTTVYLEEALKKESVIVFNLAFALFGADGPPSGD